MIILFIFLSLILIESSIRFYRFRFLPLQYRLAYALFLLSRKIQEELYGLNQRIFRGSFENLKEYSDHISLISGIPSSKLKPILLPKNIFRNKYSSGLNGIISQDLKMHLGLLPKANQNLQTISTTSDNLRTTVNKPKASKPSKTVFLLGGSVAFGLGATSDSATIASVMAHELNEKSDLHWTVLNKSMFGFNSLQELISLLQSKEKPDYVFCLSGWNDVGQAFLAGGPGVSALAKSCEIMANASFFEKFIREILGSFQTLFVLKRFLFAFRNFEKLDSQKNQDKFSKESSIYPLY